MDRNQATRETPLKKYLGKEKKKTARLVFTYHFFMKIDLFHIFMNLLHFHMLAVAFISH